MPNITLAIDGEVLEKARRTAEAQGTSINQLVREYLQGLIEPQATKELVDEFLQLSKESRADSMGWKMGWKFDREEIHQRR